MKKIRLTQSLRNVFCEARKESTLNYHVKDFEKDLNTYANNNKSVLPSHFELVNNYIENDKFKKLVLLNWLSNRNEIDLTPKQKMENLTNFNHRPIGMFDNTPTVR